MHSRIQLRAALSALLLSATFTAASAAEKLDLDRVTPVPETETIPVTDFFRPKILQDPKLNIAGTHIAAIISPSLDHTELMVYDLKTQKIERIGGHRNSDIYRVDWLNEKRLVYQISILKMAGTGLFAGEVGSLTSAYPLVQYVGSELIAVPPEDRTRPLVRLAPYSYNTGQYAEVVTLRTDINTGTIDASEAETRENNNRHIVTRYPVLKTTADFDYRYLADKAGKLAYGMTYSDDGNVHLHQFTGTDWIQSPLNLDEIDIVDAGDNPGEVVALAARAEGKPRPLQVMDAATGATREVLLTDKNYDFNGWLFRDPVSHLIVGAVFDRSGPAVVWFTQAYRDLQKLLDAKFPGLVVRIRGLDDAGKMVLVSTFSDRQPEVYHWVDLQNRTGGLFKNSTPWIDPKRMQPMSVIKYKTRDGKQLDAYVTMPAGASKQNPPPLIVLPHDGPFHRNTWGFDKEVQFLASRGYAVLQPNYRGSPGYNWMFTKEDEWDFRRMSDDVTDATKALINAGLVDSTRVGIMGTGFGGYLALSGAAFNPSIYRTVVGISPNYDWGKFIEENKDTKYSNPFYVRAKLKLGDPKSNGEKFEAMAPLRHAGEIRAAVFISQGQYDDSFEIAQGKQLLSVVSRNNLPTESVTFRDESAGVRRLDHKVELYTRIEAFLAKNLAAR